MAKQSVTRQRIAQQLKLAGGSNNDSPRLCGMLRARLLYVRVAAQA